MSSPSPDSSDRSHDLRTAMADLAGFLGVGAMMLILISLFAETGQSTPETAMPVAPQSDTKFNIDNPQDHEAIQEIFTQIENASSQSERLAFADRILGYGKEAELHARSFQAIWSSNDKIIRRTYGSDSPEAIHASRMLSVAEYLVANLTQ